MLFAHDNSLLDFILHTEKHYGFANVLHMYCTLSGWIEKNYSSQQKIRRARASHTNQYFECCCKNGKIICSGEESVRASVVFVLVGIFIRMLSHDGRTMAVVGEGGRDGTSLTTSIR